MSGFTEVPLPDARFVTTDNDLTYPELAFDETWTNEQKLAWHAALIANETGLRISIYDGARVIDGKSQTGHYCITVGTSSAASFRFKDAWNYLNGVSCGARQTQQGGTRGLRKR